LKGLETKKQSFSAVPSPRGALVGLAPKQNSKTLQIEVRNTVNQLSFVNFQNAKPVCTNLKPSYERLSGDGSDLPIEIPCNRTDIILNRFLNIPTMISELSNPFSASCKTISPTGNSQLFSHYLLLIFTQNIDSKGLSLSQYLSGPALTSSTLISWFIGSGQLGT